jgi:hypothetical protein
MAQGREDVARWAAAHHDAEQWEATGIPTPVVDALRAADND